jgi:hypothetical protein
MSLQGRTTATSALEAYNRRHVPAPASSLAHIALVVSDQLTSVIPRKKRHATRPPKLCTSAVHADTTAQTAIHVDM